MLLLKKIKDKISNISIKRSCLVCQMMTDRYICLDCCSYFSVIENYCQICGSPITESKSKTNMCGKCIVKKPNYDRCITSFKYEFPIKQIIHLIKYKSKYELIDILIENLIINLKQHYKNHAYPQVVIPIPMHRISLYNRGFNQSLMLAKAILKNLKLHDIELADEIVHRRYKTKPQYKLNISSRKKNVCNAFYYVSTRNYDHVAIVDDVVTSGATVSEVAKILRANGVNKIDIWCLARATLGKL